jgi:hypothetical protein
VHPDIKSVLSSLFSLMVLTLLFDSMPQLVSAQQQTPPSSVYYDRHSHTSLIHGLPYALDIAGTHQNEWGAQIIELRGWIRIPKEIPLSCFQTRDAPEYCINLHDNPPDFTYGLELDPVWMQQQGIDINQVVRVGSLLDQTRDQDYSTSAGAIIKVELMSWHFDQKLPGREREFGGGRDVPQPSGWNFVVPTQKYGDTFWPWDPRYPSDEDPRTNPNAVPLGHYPDGTKRPDSDLDYVRIVGSLVIDYPHNVTWKYPFPHIPNAHMDPNNPARWTEIHPPDLIERIEPPKDPNGMVHKETVRCVAAVAENGYGGTGEINSFYSLIQAPPRPDPLAQLKYIEDIDRTGNTNDRTVSNKDVLVYPHYGYIIVGGRVEGEGYLGAYGKFKACYRVFWEPGPPQIRTRIEPDTIMVRTPTTMTVHAEDWHTGRPVNGQVIIGDVEVGSTNTPFTYTFNSNASSWYGDILVLGKAIAPNYVDANLPFRIALPKLEVRAEPNRTEISQETQVTIYASDPETHTPVSGEIFISQPGEYFTIGQRIGSTNTPFTYTFELIPSAEPDVVDEVLQCPGVVVTALGYHNTIAPITFTGDCLKIAIRDPPPVEDGPGDGNGSDPCLALRRPCE